MKSDMISTQNDLDEFKCNGFLEAIEDPILLRKLFAGAIKFVIHQKHWNYDQNVKLRHSIKGVAFDNHPNILVMQETFKNRGEKKMLEENTTNKCLRSIVKYNRGLQGKAKKRLRIKRINLLVREFRKRLDKNTKRDMRNSQGVILFGYSIRDQFIILKHKSHENS